MKRLLPFIVAIIVLIGLVVAVPVLLQPERYRSQIADLLSKQWHHSVVIGKVDMGYFPPVLRLHETAVFQTPDAPFLQVDEIDAAPDWASLLRGELRPRALTLAHPVATTRRRPDGTWNWDEWFSRTSSVSAAAGGGVRLVTVHEGEFRWIDPSATQGISLLHVEGVVDEDRQTATFSGATEGLASAVTFTFEGKGEFLKSRQWSGDARFADEGRSWVVHLEDQSGHVDAKGQAAQWRWDSFFSVIAFYARWGTPRASSAGEAPVLMQDWKTHFTVDGGSVTFYHAAAISGGLSEVKGDVVSQEARRIIHVSGAFEDVPVSIFTAGFENAPAIDGKLTGITRFELPLSSQTWSGFTGQGSIEIKSGQYVFPQSSLKSLAKAHTTAYLNRKFPDFEDKGLEFKRFRVHWVATDGQMIFDDALFDAGDVKAAMVGKIDGPRQGIDAYIALQIRESSPDLLKEIPAHYLTGSTGRDSVQPIYGHLQGTWNEWLLRAAAARKLSAGVKAKLRTSLSAK